MLDWYGSCRSVHHEIADHQGVKRPIRVVECRTVVKAARQPDDGDSGAAGYVPGYVDQPPAEA